MAASVASDMARRTPRRRPCGPDAATSAACGHMLRTARSVGALLLAAPGWCAREIEVAGPGLAVDGGECGVEPATGAGERPRERVASEEADVAGLERVTLQLA